MRSSTLRPSTAGSAAAASRSLSVPIPTVPSVRERIWRDLLQPVLRGLDRGAERLACVGAAVLAAVGAQVRGASVDDRRAWAGLRAGPARAAASAHGGLQMLDAVPRELWLDGAVSLQPRCDGWLVVRQGTVWLTRGDGPDGDLVLAGEGAAWLPRGARVVVEPWHRGEPVRLGWGQRAEEPGQPSA
ncbi:MAG: hypothetical protein RLY78_4034 [Pseudomonadota bacterium]|jgi:hypothetical protein